VERVTEAFIWPVRDPQWLPKVLIIGLTLLIPIVGQINGIGWMLASLDRLRAGDERMADANLGYLGRGIRLFAVQLIYVFALTAVTLAVYLTAVLVAVRQSHESANPALISLAIALSLLALGIASIGGIAFTFATPAIVLATDQGGIAGGIQVGAVLRRCRANLTNTLIAGLMLIAAGFIGSFGVIACGVGVLLTAAYSLAVQAWVIRSFELGSEAARAA
jgi:hypothetical protein